VDDKVTHVKHPAVHCSSHGQPRARIHSMISLRPSCAAAEHAVASHGAPFCSGTSYI
jgi:hypothetical protein